MRAGIGLIYLANEPKIMEPSQIRCSDYGELSPLGVVAVPLLL